MTTCHPTRALEVNDPFGLLLGGVEIVGVSAGGEVLPTAAADYENDDSFGDLRGHLRGSGQCGSRRDSGEDAAFLHEAPGPVEALTGTNHALAIQQIKAVPLLEHRRDVAVFDVAQALHALAQR